MKNILGKKVRLLAVAAIALVLMAPLSSGLIAPGLVPGGTGRLPSPQVLSYVNASTGLNSIAYEFGYLLMEAADLDYDGDQDLVSLGDHGANWNTQQDGILIWWNDGTGTSWTLGKYGSDFGYGGVGVGDINGDGRWDLAYGIHHNGSGALGSHVLEVARNGGTGKSWGSASGNIPSQGEWYGMFDTDFADVNNDGLMDLGAACFGYYSGYQVYLNDGDGTWTNCGLGTGGNSKSIFEFGDFNNDGNTDIIGTWATGMAWLGDGKGGWTKMDTGLSLSSMGLPYEDMDVGDFNGDGAMDIAVIDSDAGALAAFTFNTGSQSWQPISSGIGIDGCYYADVSDLNNDGNLDIAVQQFDCVQIYLGNGAGAWTKDATLPSYNVVDSMKGHGINAGSDSDHNGYYDIYYAYGDTIAGPRMNKIYGNLNSNPVAGLSARLQYPMGAEKLMPGMAGFIDWTSAVPAGNKAMATLELSTSGTSGPWTPVATTIPNGGMYQWIVPDTPSKNCYLRVTVDDGTSTASDTNDKPFEILGSTGPDPVTITLTAPNGGENWTAGTVHDITWSTGGGQAPRSVALEYSTQGSGGPWTSIASGEQDDGTYSWTVPDAPSTNCFVKATVTDSYSTPQTASDTSAAAFEIYRSQVVPQPLVLSYVTVTPQSASLLTGDSQQFTAAAFCANGTAIPGASLSWAADNTGVGTVAPAAGAATTLTAIAAGTVNVTVTATYDSVTKTNTSQVTVTEPLAGVVISRVALAPLSFSINTGSTRQLYARAFDGSGADITSGVSYVWTVGGAVGTVNPSSGSNATTFTAIASGTGWVNVTATYNGTSVQNQSAATVTAPSIPQIYRVEISPNTVNVETGDSTALTATSYDTNGNVLSSSVTYNWELAGNVGTLSSANTQSTSFTATAAGTGTITVTATYDSLSKQNTVSVTVTDPITPPPIAIDRVEISPSSFSGKVGNSLTATAKAYDANNNELTSGVTYQWTVNPSSVAGLDTSSGKTVTLSLQKAGTAQLTVVASYNGTQKTDTAALTVQAASGPETTADSGIPILYVILPIVIVVIIVVLVVVAALMRRKKKEPPQQQWAAPPPGGYQQYPQQGQYGGWQQ